MSGHAPWGPLAVLAGLVAGIAAGEAAGPGAAVGVLAMGLAGVAVAAFLGAPPVRLAVAVVAFALVGTAVMQRALHGLAVSPLRDAVEHGADARLVGTLVDDPESSRFDARALVRVADVSGRGGGGRRVLVARVGRRRRTPPHPLGGRGRRGPWVVRPARGLRHPVAVEARGRRVPRHRAARREPCPWAACPRRQRRPGPRALRLAAPRAGRPCAARRLPPRRHPGRPRHPHRAVPGGRPHAPDRGVRGERGVRVGVVRAVPATARLAWPGRRRARGARAASAP